MAGQKYKNGNNSSYMAPNDENPEIGQIQAKGPSEEGRRPKWRRMKAQGEKDEGPEAETLSRLLIVAEGPD